MGQYGCDAPYILINSTLQFVATQEVDFIIITGDLPPHDVWEQSRAENLNATKMVFQSGSF
jgi:sphingomyelin phosphodiesterase